MAKFALLLNHAPDRYEGLSEDEMMAIIKDYVAWVESMAAKGLYHGGEKLAPGPGATLSKRDGQFEVHDSPYAELAEVLGGFMIIEAENLEAAIELAKGHPHFTYNPSLTIHEVGDTA